MKISRLISVIVPCYNAENTIKATIQSVLLQTYSNWELLIVDDCSTDDSVKIINQYSIKDPRIKLLSTDKNTGSPSEPRNIALEAAKGQYIAFLDADDTWLPNKLEEQLEFLEMNDFDFVYSNYEKMNYQGKRNNRIVCARSVSTYWDILESNGIPCLTALLRRKIIGDIRFQQTPKEDYVFWLTIMRTRNVTAYNTNKIHAIYRESKNSRSGDKWDMIRKQWYVLRMVENVKASVTRKGNVTTYKVFFPWKAVGLQEAPRTGSRFGFAAAVNDLDSGSRKALCLFQGIVESKDPVRYGSLYLTE